MPDRKSSIADRIRAKLGTGDLRCIGPKNMWDGFGDGNPCDGCGEPFLTTDVEYAFAIIGDLIYRFHTGCAGIWQAELKRHGVT